MTEATRHATPMDSAAVKNWHAETDVLIVGGGGAGICAAIEAADAGASVMVLEAASEPGGSTAMAGGLIYMGGGIRIGMDAGGTAINMHEGFVCTPFYPPHQFIESIIVNETGNRFINEDVYHGRLGSAILDRPEGRYYLIIDSRHFDVLQKPPMGGYPVKGTGESIEELEEELELPQRALVDTLAAYNHSAKNFEDPLHHKNPRYLVPLDQPPYAAFDLTLGNGAIFATMTFGGLDTLPTGEVLTVDKETVPGLYAAGRNSAGLPRCAEGYASGMSIGDATFFGRLAGQSAAMRYTR